MTADLPFPGPRNRAHRLLALDTPERRARADWEGDTLNNLIGGRPSDSVARAVSALLAMIANGTEDEEMYGERTARLDRERQAEEREARFQSAAAMFRSRR